MPGGCCIGCLYCFRCAPARLSAGLCGCWAVFQSNTLVLTSNCSLGLPAGVAHVVCCAIAQAVHTLSALLLDGAGAAACNATCALPPSLACLSLHHVCPAFVLRRWCGGSPRATPLPTCRAPRTSSPSPPCGTGVHTTAAGLGWAACLFSRVPWPLCTFQLALGAIGCLTPSAPTHPSSFLCPSPLPCPQQPAPDSAGSRRWARCDCGRRVWRPYNPCSLPGRTLVAARSKHTHACPSALVQSSCMSSYV